MPTPATPAPAVGRRLVHLDAACVHSVVDAVPDHLHKVDNSGVDLFFVLSGYPIGGLLLAGFGRRGSADVGRFLVRRAFKIWPAYLIGLTACCLADAYAGSDVADDSTPGRTVFDDMWPAYLHVQNYFRSTGRFGWFWSLGVEEHFYLLPPGAIPVALAGSGGGGRAFRRAAGLVAVTGAVCLVLRGRTLAADADLDDAYTRYFPTHLRIDPLMGGVALAAARFAAPALERLRPWRYAVGGAAAGVIGYGLVERPFPAARDRLFPRRAAPAPGPPGGDR